ncbi:MAG: DNA glycosylase AlkZ-like family protein [Pseudomonadota bacterium]
MDTLTLTEARRLAVRATRLDAPRPRSILEVVRDTGPLQLDPTRSIARSEHLVLFSRLGPYDVAELDRLLWEDRELFTWRAFLHPLDDWPLVRAVGKRFPSEREARVGRWLEDNAAFRRYVLSTLRRRGPLRQSELEDRSVRPWVSTGWTHGKNVGQLLEFLWRQGEVLVAGRVGQERVWDLAERVVPPAKPLPAAAAARRHVEERFRQVGPMTASGFKRVHSFWLLPVDEAFRALVRDEVLVPHEVEGLKGPWYVHRDLLADRRPFRGRTTVLSPFDPLVYDRRRAEELWGFRYKLEIYVPPAKREFGYYVLPILHGGLLAGRVDVVHDRRANVLRVNGLWWEDAPVPAIDRVLDDLRRWVRADSIER